MTSDGKHKSGALALLGRLTAPQNHPVLIPLCAVGLALLVCFIAIWLTGRDPIAGYQKMFLSGLGTLRGLGDSSVKAAVLALTGLSVAVAFAAGLFNIGCEGQLAAGAIASAFVGQAIHPGTAWIHVPLALLAAALAGALWALIAAWLKVRRGVHEVISTIMLNWTAIYLVESWLVTGPLSARSETGNSLPGTAQIDATAELPRFFGSRSDLGFAILLAVLTAVLVWILLRKTWVGFEMRASGDSAETARASGIPVEKRVYLAMAVSGACSGLAGAILILGVHHQYPAVFRPGYGFDGIAVSLIGGNHPLGLLLAACFFGVIRTGGAALQLLHIHRTFPELIQGLALLFIAGRAIMEHALTALHERAAALPSPEVSGSPAPSGLTEKGSDATQMSDNLAPSASPSALGGRTASDEAPSEKGGE